MSNFIYEEPEQISISAIFRSGTASKEYDGTPLTNPEVSITVTSASSNKRIIYVGRVTITADFQVTGSQTVVGWSENTFSYDVSTIKVFYDQEDITDISTLDIQKRTGTLTVILKPGV